MTSKTIFSVTLNIADRSEIGETSTRLLWALFMVNVPSFVLRENFTTFQLTHCLHSSDDFFCFLENQLSSPQFILILFMFVKLPKTREASRYSIFIGIERILNARAYYPSQSQIEQKQRVRQINMLLAKLTSSGKLLLPSSTRRERK